MAKGTRWDWLTVDREECEDIIKHKGKEREKIALGYKQVESKEKVNHSDVFPPTRLYTRTNKRETITINRFLCDLFDTK